MVTRKEPRSTNFHKPVPSHAMHYHLFGRQQNIEHKNTNSMREQTHLTHIFAGNNWEKIKL